MLVGLPLLASDVTTSAFWVAMTSAAQHLPWLLVGIWVAIRVDRSNPVRAMVRADIARMVCVGLLGVAVVIDAVSIPLLIAVAAAIGLGDLVFAPASTAVVPRLVPPQMLPRANGVMTTMEAVGESVGPIAGGLLYSAGRAVPFFGDAATFGISAVLLGRIDCPPVEAPEGATPRVAGSLRWFIRVRPLRLIALLTAVMALGQTMVLSVLVLIGTRHLGLSDSAYGVFFATTALGSVIGSLLADRIWARLGTLRALSLGACLMVTAYVVVGTSSSALVTAAALFVESMFVPVSNVITMTLRQTIAPPDRIGQATSIFRLFVLGAIPLGALLSGLLADATTPQGSALAAAIIVAAGSTILLARLRTVPEFAGQPLDESPESHAGI